MVMEMPGKRRRGIPRRRLLDNINNDLSERELSGEEAKEEVQWRRFISNVDPHVKVGMDAKEEEDVSCTCKKQYSGEYMANVLTNAIRHQSQ